MASQGPTLAREGLYERAPRFPGRRCWIGSAVFITRGPADHKPHHPAPNHSGVSHACAFTSVVTGVEFLNSEPPAGKGGDP